MVKDHSNLTVGPGSEQSQVFLEVEPISPQPSLNSVQAELCITVDQRLELRVDSDRGVSLAASFIAALDTVKAEQSSRVQFMLNQEGGAL